MGCYSLILVSSTGNHCEFPLLVPVAQSFVEHALSSVIPQKWLPLHLT